MSTQEPDVIFEGRSGPSSDEFIRFMRRRAITSRIQDDDRLIAQTAACYLGGGAAEWFEDQTEEVQESWKLLRRAIMKQWPAATPRSPAATTPVSAKPTNAAAIPTPAAAPPAAAAHRPSATGVPPAGSFSDDDIKVYAEGLWDYPAQDPEDVSFKQGDLVEVLDTRYKLWWMVRNLKTGRQGTAPSNYLQIVSFK